MTSDNAQSATGSGLYDKLRDTAPGMLPRPMRMIYLNNLGYGETMAKQEEVHAEVLAGGVPAILFVEHPPTITLGRRVEASRSHLLATPGELQRLGIEVVESDRGGDITYHGPGQLVAYPIVRLADYGLSVGAYMRLLQESAVDALGVLHVPAELDATAPGVWCHDPLPDGPPAKVAAVGVRVRRGVTMHGLALNVEPNVSHFHLIDPCGLGRPVTSLHKLLGAGSPSILAVKAVLRDALVRQFDAKRQPVEKE